MPSAPKLDQDARIRVLYDEGLSAPKISMQLWREGFTNAVGVEWWPPESLVRALSLALRSGGRFA